MALIVHKYGGTSMGSTERIRSVAKRVAKWARAGHQMIVVPSAMSGETNRLLALAKDVSPARQTAAMLRELDMIACTGEQGEYVRGAARIETEVHPFRRHFEELRIGESLLTHRRTVSEADIVNFGGISGDYFYMHFDEIAAKDTAFGQRIAHGYFVLSAAAGLFVSPAPGPVLANYGLDTLRFVKPVAIGDTIQARLTAKRKIDRMKVDAQGRGQGVVAWDVEVTNQAGELVASYDILTLVAKKG